MDTCKKVEYYAIRADCVDDLNRIVNKYIQDGWTPLGGISCAIGEMRSCSSSGYRTKYEYCQAMIKHDV
jgi:hypothetical protein